MSSKEIADLLDLRHDNLKRAIERLADKGVFALPQSEEVKITKSNGALHKVQVYLCDKRTSMIVVAQLSPEATARIVDRWQELEAEVAKPLSGSSLMAAALIEAERTLNERLKAQAIQIEDMSEDLGALERIAPAFSLKSNRGV